MPFTDHYLLLKFPQYKNPLRFIRVYRPDNESAETFEHDLDEILDKAMLHALYKQGEDLFDIVIFGIADPENTLSSEFKNIMRQRGILPDKDVSGLFTITFPLSWEIDPRLLTLQERLQKEVSLADPADAYDPNELVAQHNAKALQKSIKDVFGVELDLSLHSLVHLDDIITMRQDDENWRFHMFTETFLTACGDYTGEVIRAIFPEAQWTKEERPLELRGATLAPRAKVIKLCCNGFGDSLETYVQLLQFMMGGGKS
jgi:hypothetical protein